MSLRRPSVLTLYSIGLESVISFYSSCVPFAVLSYLLQQSAVRYKRDAMTSGSLGIVLLYLQLL